MGFAAPLPPWLTVLLVALAGVVAYRAYARPSVPLSTPRRWGLGGVRMLTLLFLLACLAQPVRLISSGAERVVPVLIDHSRSMAVADVDGRERLAAAVAWVADELDDGAVSLASFGVGDGVRSDDPLNLRAEAPRSRLRDGVQDIRERFPSAPAVVLLTDGGETAREASAIGPGPPVFAVGVGAPTLIPDREVVELRVGRAVTAEAAAELSFTIVARGEETALEARVLEDGRLLRVVSVATADGVSAVQRLTVTPHPDRATRYTVELPVRSDEVVAGNNRRSVLVPPAGRPRRLLLVEGGPGYDHSFLKRVLRADAGVEADAVIEKGRNNRGERTFYIQSRAAAAGSLAEGFPETRQALFRYDAVILANLDVALLRPVQAEMLRAFVSERGGGLLVLGTRSFEGRGWRDLGLADLLPLTPGAGARFARFGGAGGDSRARPVSLTRDGESHPVMQLGSGALSERWRRVPPLGEVARLGAAAPGASVLLTALGEGDGPLPAVAVHRFGRGRVMAFPADASWRWQMLAGSEDDTYERFWRQTARWLADEAPEPLEVEVTGGRADGDRIEVRVHARDAEFVPRTAADVSVRLEGPDGRVVRQPALAVSDQAGRYVAALDAVPAGVHRVSVEVGVGEERSERVESVVLVGGADPELAEPARQDDVLASIATESGGQWFGLDEAAALRDALEERLAVGTSVTPVDIWNQPWVFLVVVGLLCAEWVLRRRWGLR